MTLVIDVSVEELNMVAGWARVVADPDCVVHPGDVVRAAVCGSGGVICGTVARTSPGPDANTLWIELAYDRPRGRRQPPPAPGTATT